MLGIAGGRRTAAGRGGRLAPAGAAAPDRRHPGLRQRRPHLGPVRRADGTWLPYLRLAIGIGALLDGIPNRSHRPVMLGGRAASVVAVAAIFLSNIPEGLSSAAGMKQAGRSRGYVFGIWGGTAFASGVAALLGYAVFRHFPPDGGSDHGHRGRRGSANDRRHHDPGGLRRHV